MINEKRNHRRILVILLGIMLAQCINLLDWQDQRGNFFIDELLCFGYAQSFTSDTSHYITDDQVWKYNEWMSGDELNAQLRLDKNEHLSALPVSDQLRLLATKRTYMGLVNMIMTAEGDDASYFDYAKGALDLNLWFFLFSELLIAYCIRRLTRSDEIMLLSIFMFGFSAIMVGICEYLRFYMLTIMLMMAVVTIHLVMWTEKNILKNLAWEAAALLCAYYAFKHSELMLVTCGSLFVFFFLGLLCRGRFKQAAVYSAPLIYGMYEYVYRRTNLIDVILHPADYADPDVYGVPRTSYYLITWTPETGMYSWLKTFDIIKEKWFGSAQILAAFGLILAIGFAARLIAWIRKEEDKKEKTANAGFAAVIFMTALTSLAFNLLTYLHYDRYNTFLIVLFMLVLWCCIAGVQKAYDKRIFLVVVGILTITGAVMCHQPERLPYLYIDDSAMKNIAEEYPDTDSVLFSYGENAAIYDNIIHLGDGSRMFAVDPEKEISANDIKGLPDEFLAWTVNSWFTKKLMRAINNTEYTAHYVGKTWQNQIFLCTKK